MLKFKWLRLTLLGHLSFQILDKPGPPRNLRNETVTNTLISVKWEAPIFDGNSPITNYTVSYKLENSAINMVNVINNTSINLIDLTPAKTYVIVVSANNNHFPGIPTQITVVTADSGTVFAILFWTLFTFIQKW